VTSACPSHGRNRRQQNPCILPARVQLDELCSSGRLQLISSRSPLSAEDCFFSSTDLAFLKYSPGKQVVAAVAVNLSLPGHRFVPRYVLAALRLQTASDDRTNRSGPPLRLSEQEGPTRESGAFDFGWNGDDYMVRLAPAALSAAKVFATVRTAEASMRRESARLTAAAAAETTSARRA
jgi:hypothetical protein